MSKKASVVDDSSSFRQVVSMTLTQAGYDVTEAVDGRDGIDKVATQAFNVMVCDLNMPKVSGFDFARHVRTLPQHRFTPILMLTTETSAASKAEGKAAGVTAWLGKPFQPSRLMLAVNTVTSR